MTKLNQAQPKQVQTRKRAILTFGAAAIASPIWVKPVVNTMLLPAHAQTTNCVTDMTIGGPLSGAPNNPASCQIACEAEAAALNAQLCEVRETPTATGTDCACDIDIFGI